MNILGLISQLIGIKTLRLTGVIMSQNYQIHVNFYFILFYGYYH